METVVREVVAELVQHKCEGKREPTHVAPSTYTPLGVYDRTKRL
jgi:hypothetical protein